jgi:hypothetical protein
MKRSKNGYLESVSTTAEPIVVKRMGPEEVYADTPHFIQNMNAILHNAELRSRPTNKKWWTDDQTNGHLAMMKKIFILKHSLRIANSPIAAHKQLQHSLYQRLKSAQCLPRRKGGRATRDDRSKDYQLWDELTVGNWIADRGPSPTVKEANLILDNLIDLVEDDLTTLGRTGPPISEIFKQFSTSPADTLRQVLSSINVPQDGAYVPPDHYKPLVNDSFLGDAEPIDPTELIKAAEDSIADLVRPNGAHLVSIKGPPASGKKMVIRYVVKRLPQHKLRLLDGSRLPILALPLDELTPIEFVDNVYRFYSSAQGPSQAFLMREETDSYQKLEKIREMARTTPACILVSDVSFVDAHEIIRHIDQDYVGDVLVGIIRGHPLTRLLITTSNEADEGLQHEALRAGRRAISISLTEKISPPDDSRHHFLGMSTTVNRSTWRLAFVAQDFIEDRCTSELNKTRHQMRCQLSLENNRPLQIVDHLWKDLLEADERLLVGLIASSQDGIRASVLRRMVAAFKLLNSEVWQGSPPTEGDILARIARLQMLVQIRPSREREPVSLDRHDRQEALFFLDDGWRRDFVRMWFKYSDSIARLGQWLIARDAAARSRALRIFGVGQHTSAALEQDVRALRSLIYSIDPSKVDDYRNVRRAPRVPLEEQILPPLEIHAKGPDPTLVLRYAYLQLLRDIENEKIHFANILDHAALRLSFLLPFFLSNQSWQRLDETILEPSLDSYKHLVNGLSPSEFIELLHRTAMAALRARRFDIIKAVARLGEEAASQTNDPNFHRSSVLPLLRTEIDAAILLGCNPDAILPPHNADAGVQIAGIAARLNTLITSPFCDLEGDSDRESKIERGKLHARLGEVLHLAGCVRLAGREFEKAVKIETELILTPGTMSYSVLGGHGARRYLRYLLDEAKRMAWSKAFDPLRFDDQMAIPLPIRLFPDDTTLIEARRLYDLNVRRLNSGRIVDRLATAIDGARIAAIQHNYAEALALLNAPGTVQFGVDSSIEVFVELMAVRVQFLVEVSVLTLASEIRGSAFPSHDRIVEVARYMRCSQDGTSRTLMHILLEEARDNLSAFQRLVTKPGMEFRPYAIFGRLMDLWCRILSSRLVFQEGNQEAIIFLEKTRLQLDLCLTQMRRVRYRMHLLEVILLRQGIGDALQYRRANTPETQDDHTVSGTPIVPRAALDCSVGST